MKRNELFLHSSLLIIIIASSIFSMAYGNLDNIQTLLKNGRDAVRDTNFTGAIYYFNQVLAIEPNNTSGLINKGVALGNLYNYTGAIYYFDQVLKIDPTNVDALNNKGAALIKQDKFDEANSIFDKVLKIEPKNAVALSNKKVMVHRLSPTAPYDTSRYTLFSQIEIRDKDNNLISYMEPRIVEVPDPDRLDQVLDTWSAGKFNQSGTILTIEKSIIQKNGKNFERIDFQNVATYDDANPVMVSKTGYTIDGDWIIYDYHDGYQLEYGDKEVLKFVIIRPVG